MTEVKFNLKSVGYWELICFMWKCTICAFCAYVAIPAFVIAVISLTYREYNFNLAFSGQIALRIKQYDAMYVCTGTTSTRSGTCKV